MDLIYALLIALGLRQPAPKVYQAPVQTLPLVVPLPDGVLSEQMWGPLP